MYKKPFPLRIFKSSKTVQDASKTVNFGLESSIFCGFTLTVLQPHFDYFTLQDSQNDAPNGKERHSKPHFHVLQSCFSCVYDRARKCQPRCLYDIIKQFSDYAFFLNILVRRKKNPISPQARDMGFYYSASCYAEENVYVNCSPSSSVCLWARRSSSRYTP